MGYTLGETIEIRNRRFEISDEKDYPLSLSVAVEIKKLKEKIANKRSRAKTQQNSIDYNEKLLNHTYEELYKKLKKWEEKKK